MSNNIQGVLWALLATALFCIVAAMAKVAVADYHVLQVLFFRQLIVFITTLPFLVATFPRCLKTRHPWAHAARLAGAFIALSAGVWAVAVLPLTTAVTLGFAKVFFVAVLALVILKESVGPHRLLAIILGFIGVIIVMRPSPDGLADINALIPIVGALGAAVAVICVRRLSQTESTATLLIYQAVFVGVLSGVPLFWLWVTPSWPDFVLLITMGVLASVAQWVGIKALRLGEASLVGNVEYMKMIYATALGFVLFAELPDAHTVVGAAIIVGSSLYIFRREALRNVAALKRPGYDHKQRPQADQAQQQG